MDALEVVTMESEQRCADLESAEVSLILFLDLLLL